MRTAPFARLLVLAAVACSAEERAARSGPTPVSTDVDDDVSFRNDVVPLLATSCAFSSCHGAGRPLVLGDKRGRVTGEDVHAALVGVPSSTLPSMPYVTAFDPTKSFLLAKVDGTEGAFTAACDGHDCGDSMPPDGAPLSDDQRNLLRRWVAQGARDDGATSP